MGFSFKVARTGVRYRPPPPPPEPDGVTYREPSPSNAEPSNFLGVDLLRSCNGFADYSDSSVNCERNHLGLDNEASFSLNLFPDGYSIAKPTQGLLLPLVEDAPDLLHPYDSASKSLFHAIECGWLPGDVFDCIPCKYFSGTLICEVLDFRTLVSIGSDDLFANEFPKVHKMRLRMGMENVVKDISLISDDSWTYHDLLQVESRIIKTLQPILDLGPNPSWDRLYSTSFSKQFDFGIYRCNSTAKQHDRQESSRSHKCSVPSNDFSENSKSQEFDGFKDRVTLDVQFPPTGTMPIALQNDKENDIFGRTLLVAFQASDNSANCLVSDHRTVAGTSTIVAAPVEEMGGLFVGVKNSVAVLGKRNKNFVESNPALKRSKKEEAGLGDPAPKKEQAYLGKYQFATRQKAAPYVLKWKDGIIPSKRQQDAHFLQHLRPDGQNCTQLKTSEANAGKNPLLQAWFCPPLHETGLLVRIKEELVEDEMVSKQVVGMNNNILARNEKSNCRRTVISRRPLPPQMQERNTGPFIKKSAIQKISGTRKLSKVPQVSVVVSNCSRVSKMGKSESLGTSSSMHSNVLLVGSEIEKPLLSPVSVGSAVQSRYGNSLAKPNQTPVRTKELKVHSEVASTMSGLGSPASVVGSPSIRRLSGTYCDKEILHIFSMIKMAVNRHGLNDKKKKVGNTPQKELSLHFTLPKMPEDSEKFYRLKDCSCMSKCIIGGSRNTCQTRVVTYVRVRFDYKGNDLRFLFDETSCKLVLFLSENLGDHRVGAVLVYGDIEKAGQRIPLAVLPSVHHADLFAAQFTSLMECDGYKLVNDHFHSAPASIASVSTNNSRLITYSGFTELPPLSPVSRLQIEGVSLSGSSLSYPNCYQLSSPDVLWPESYCSFSKPYQLEGFSHLNCMQIEHLQKLKPLPLVRHSSLGEERMHPMLETPSSSVKLQRLYSQQLNLHQLQQAGILRGKVTELGATNNVPGSEGCVCLSNLELNNEQEQISAYVYCSTHFLGKEHLHSHTQNS